MPVRLDFEVKRWDEENEEKLIMKKKTDYQMQKFLLRSNHLPAPNFS
jgi:hypothetical protein